MFGPNHYGRGAQAAFLYDLIQSQVNKACHDHSKTFEVILDQFQPAEG